MQQFRLFYSVIFFVGICVSLEAQINPLDVFIMRDDYGTPHIKGKTDADAIYGLAWAHAEDDFETIQHNMLMAKHMLGLAIGKEGAKIDFAVQFLQAENIVAEKYDSDVSPEFKKILEAYAQGLNDFAITHKKEVLIKKSFPVTPQDILSGYVISLSLLSGVDFQLVNIIENRAGGPVPHSMRGSNGFALNSNITDDGSVFLANNSHQPIEGQLAWYEAHIASDEGLNCLGGLFPGGVSIFAGCNENLAWMHTVNYPDFIDVYELEMHPEEKLKYKFDGEWLELEEVKAKMKVKIAGIPITIGKKFYLSVYGPTLKNDSGYYSMRLGANMNIGAAEQWFRMNKTENFSSFYKVLERQGLPGLNIVYGDKNDTIFYLNNGLFPKRAKGYNWRGLLPGNTSKTLWTEYLPIEDLPQVLNPNAGYVFNTNNTPFHSTARDECPVWLEHDTTMGQYLLENNRSLRFEELINEEKEVSYSKFRSIKYDQSYPDTLFIQFISNPEELFKLSPSKYPDIAAAIQIGKNWNRSSDKENSAASLFLLCYRHLQKMASVEHKLFESRTYPEKAFVSAYEYAQEYLLNNFGTLNVPLGQLQRHIRGDHNKAIGGLPDVISAMYSQPWKGGRLKSWLGDSYIQLIRFTDGKVFIESVMPYGASNRKDSPHYSDQMEMFVNQQTKNISLYWPELEKKEYRRYHPGE